MRILAITAGTAGMYCGSCIRDNALAAELIRQGHQVQLLPLYTPTRTDEVNVSENRVFYGGISVYLEQYVPLLRKTPRLFDLLWDSPRVLRALSRLTVSTNPRQLGALTASMLRGEDGNQRKELFKLLAWLRSQPTPDVVSLPFTLLIRLAEPIRRALGCPVCCTLQGEDLFLEGLQEPYRSESLELIRAHVHTVDAYLAVSHYCADFMADYLHIPRGKIHAVPLGINLEGYPEGPTAHRENSKPFTIGYFARITPEKGLDRLAEAYCLLRKQSDLPTARLEAAGYLGPEYKGYLRAIERRIKKSGLGEEFSYRGVLSRQEKIRFLQSLNVLSVPGSYAEPKGLYLLEAMACGVPVVQPRQGAFPEILEKTGGGILVEPGDAKSLAAGILSLWENPARAEDLGRRGHQGVRAHFGVQQEARRALEVFQTVSKTMTLAEHPAAVAGRT
jgi:glycosyltransferase involved in cell wall biosynthesis